MRIKTGADPNATEASRRLARELGIKVSRHTVARLYRKAGFDGQS